MILAGDRAQGYIDKVMFNLRAIETFAAYFFGGLLILNVIFSVALAAKASAGSGWSVLIITLGTTLIVMVSAAVVGGFLGFLFGIPRSLQGSKPAVEGEAPSGSDVPKEGASSAAVSRAFKTNTSLEEISDWLTKIIIGLGLVQFQLIIDYLYRSSVFAAALVAARSVSFDENFGKAYDPNLATPFFFALIVAALVAGCLFAYLETRTRLLLLFGDAETANTDYSEERKKAAEANRPVEVLPPLSAPAGSTAGRPPAPIAIAPTSSDVEVSRYSLQKLATVDEIVGWASAQARTGNFEQALLALREALKKNEDNNSVRERIIEVLRLKGETREAVKMAVELADRTGDEARRYELLSRALYDALYLAPPDGFTEALAVSSKLLDLPKARTSATVHLWRACALGQKYKSLQGAGALLDQPEMVEIRSEALQLLSRVVALAPAYESSERELMRSLYEGTFGSEDDLKVFQSPEFDAVVYSGRS